jgi:predicted  nucleic acid-binding Zn ribbon protein
MSSQLEPLIFCPRCGAEMRLIGVEDESNTRDIFTFECDDCGQIEARSVVTR